MMPSSLTFLVLDDLGRQVIEALPESLNRGVRVSLPSEGLLPERSNPPDLANAAVVGDAGERTTLESLRELCGGAIAARTTGQVWGYFALSLDSDIEAREMLCQCPLFQRVFLFDRSALAPDLVGEMAAVLEAQAVQEIADIIRRRRMRRWGVARARRRPVAGDSLPDSLASGGARATRFEEEVLPVAFNAVDLIVGDVQSRVGKVLQMVAAVTRGEAAVLDNLLAPVRDLSISLPEEGETSSFSAAWRDCRLALSHATQAESLVLSALQKFCRASGPVDRESLKSLLQGGTFSIQDPEWEEEKKALGELTKSVCSREIRKTIDTLELRRRFSEVCLCLLRIFESPLARRNLLHLLVFSALERAEVPSMGGGGGVIAALEGDLSSLLADLETELAVLALPAVHFSKNDLEEVQAWIGRLLGGRCQVVLTKEQAAWLYVERALDPCTPAAVKPVQGVIERIEIPSGAERGTPSVQPESAPCPRCGSEDRFEASSVVEVLNAWDERNGPPLICQRCGRLNRKSWWLCWNHGKSPLPVPIDKVRCPECILRYHRDPDHFPLSSIGVRPGFSEPLSCPRCLVLKRKSPRHVVFVIPESLVAFYRDGVNGHDRARFLEAVRQARLLDDCRCPHCGTLLIPVHHRKAAPSEDLVLAGLWPDQVN